MMKNSTPQSPTPDAGPPNGALQDVLAKEL